MCMIHAWIGLIIVTMEMPGHCGVIIVFDVKDMTDSIFCLTYILNMAPSALQTIYKIVTLACAFSYSVIGCMVVEICYLP